MRINAFREAASADFLVSTLVVPVAGRSPAPEAAAVRVLPLPGGREIAAGLPALMASPQWRQRIAAAYPLPPLATLAPATLAAAAERMLAPAPGTPVHVARSYLAPLGIALAERIGSDWVTLDLDDDDEQLEAVGRERGRRGLLGRRNSLFGGCCSGGCRWPRPPRRRLLLPGTGWPPSLCRTRSLTTADPRQQ